MLLCYVMLCLLLCGCMTEPRRWSSMARLRGMLGQVAPGCTPGRGGGTGGFHGGLMRGLSRSRSYEQTGKGNKTSCL